MRGTPRDARGPTRPSTAALPLAVALLFLTAAWGAAPLGGAWHTGLPTVYEESVDRAGAFGVRADLASQGDLAFDLEGFGPQETSQLSAGVALFDSNKRFRFMIAITAHFSPDRLIVSPPDVEEAAEQHPEGWVVETVGDGAGLDDVELSFETFEPEDGSSEAAASTGSAEPAARRLVAVGVTFTNASAGSHYAILWVGGVSESTFGVATTEQVDVETVAGTGYAVGDPEIVEGDPNVQVQETVAGETVGAKVVRDAPYEATFEHGLWGFWGDSNFKLVCQFTVGTCLWWSHVMAICSAATGTDCETTRISWTGPDGAGEDGRTIYGFLGEPAGDYAFTIDQKVDLYGPRVYDPVTRTLVFLGEDHAFLTAADTTLP